MDNVRRKWVNVHGDCFLLTFPRVTVSQNRQIFLWKLNHPYNFFNEWESCGKMYIIREENNKRFWFVRATRADMNHNLFQVWMAALAACGACSLSVTSDVRSDPPHLSKCPTKLRNVDESKTPSWAPQTNVGCDLNRAWKWHRFVFFDMGRCKRQLRAPVNNRFVCL